MILVIYTLCSHGVDTLLDYVFCLFVCSFFIFYFFIFSLFEISAAVHVQIACLVCCRVINF